MARWIFEPGHTEAEFRARHMMVTWVRGLSRTSMAPSSSTSSGHWRPASRARSTPLGSGRGKTSDAHLRSADFFDVENHPRITFVGRFTERTGDTSFKGSVELTIRGVTRAVPLDVSYLGEWKTPFWLGDENTGELRRIGFEALARIDRHDFGVSWQDELPGSGVVVGNEIELVLDAEAILLDDLERTGAIEYYRSVGALSS
jgi:polyisoprenoid-binding protein YceI